MLGVRNKTGSDDQVSAMVESAVSSSSLRKSWARLIQKIYEIDLLLCPKRQGAMKVLAFIEDDELIKKILIHLLCGKPATTTRRSSVMRIFPTLKRNLPTTPHIRNYHPSITGSNKGFINGCHLFAGHIVPLRLKLAIFMCSGKTGC